MKICDIVRHSESGLEWPLKEPEDALGIDADSRVSMVFPLEA